MPKVKVKKSKKKEVSHVTKPVEVKLPTEKDQLIDRQTELLSHLDWLNTNKLQDIGQVEVALSKVNLRLTEL